MKLLLTFARSATSYHELIMSFWLVSAPCFFRSLIHIGGPIQTTAQQCFPIQLSEHSPIWIKTIGFMAFIPFLFFLALRLVGLCPFTVLSHHLVSCAFVSLIVSVFACGCVDVCLKLCWWNHCEPSDSVILFFKINIRWQDKMSQQEHGGDTLHLRIIPCSKLELLLITVLHTESLTPLEHSL